MIFCLLLFAFELGLTLGLREGNLSFLTFIVLHSAGILFCFLITQQKLYKFRRINLYLISLTLTATTGIFGAIIGLLAGVFSLKKGRNLNSSLAIYGFEEGMHGPRDQETELIASLTEKDIKNESLIIPFKEIIERGKKNQKIEILTYLSQRYRPEFAPALIAAKKDVNEDIRVSSAAIISKIDQKFMLQYKNLILKQSLSPKSPLILLNLARHTGTYADCGILDDFRQKHFREKSIYYFQKYLKLFPTDYESCLTLAKLYLKNNQVNQALDIFHSLIRHKIKLNLIDFFWYFESLYTRREYTLIRENIKKFKVLEGLPEDLDLFVLKDILGPWSKGYLKSDISVT